MSKGSPFFALTEGYVSPVSLHFSAVRTTNQFHGCLLRGLLCCWAFIPALLCDAVNITSRKVRLSFKVERSTLLIISDGCNDNKIFLLETKYLVQKFAVLFVLIYIYICVCVLHILVKDTLQKRTKV